LTNRPKRKRVPQMNPLETNRDSRWRIHLEWMFENQPALAWTLHQQRQLGPHLDQKYQQALSLVENLKQRGQSEDEAFEVASQAILAPSDGPAMGDNPPEPMPLSQQEQVINRLRL
jgi:hypothetical protein